MRSNEIAKLGGVSVRTLRHYHALGLMPEPPRSPNGYRDYTPIDLVRLLRIKRLASLGFSLSQIADMLEELDAKGAGAQPGSTALAALDALDDELAAKIESLQEQRRVIAQLKADGLNPDMPLRFARIWQTLSAHKDFSDLDAETRIALLLVGHLYNEQELNELEGVVQALFDATVSRNIDKVHQLYESLPPDASNDQIERMVQESLALLEPLMGVFDASNWKGDEQDRDRMLKSVASAGMSAAQLRATERIGEEIEVLLAQRSVCD